MKKFLPLPSTPALRAMADAPTLKACVAVINNGELNADLCAAHYAIDYCETANTYGGDFSPACIARAFATLREGGAVFDEPAATYLVNSLISF